LAVAHAVDAIRSRAGSAAISGALWLVAAIMLQVTLGILTLLNEVPIDLALTHQAVAIVVLSLAILQVERMVPRRAMLTSPQLDLAVGKAA
jgi:cytochrome c oxidase assembly protein subunit 15